MKNNLKVIIAFILGVILTGGIVYATVSASQVGYTTGKNIEIKNVQEALDELYDKTRIKLNLNNQCFGSAQNWSDSFFHIPLNNIDKIEYNIKAVMGNYEAGIGNVRGYLDYTITQPLTYTLNKDLTVTVTEEQKNLEFIIRANGNSTGYMVFNSLKFN